MSFRSRNKAELGGWNRAGAIFLFCATVVVASPAQTTFKTLVNLGGATGEYPLYMSLTQGTDGNFYGTTSYAGGPNGGGTVFKVTAAGALTVVYSFCVQTYCADGAEPYGGLVQATDGSFYGTTFYGGAYYDGEVFKVTPGGTLTVLHSFKRSDGSNPIAGLIQATDGAFYGTTSGIANRDYGTVFKITRSGRLTTLHAFDRSDGAEPYGALVQATDGMFYGTASGGGRGGGTIFKIAPRGKLTTLHIFGSTDGFYPYGGLLQASDGNFYGTAAGGGAYNAGTVFKVTPRGKLTTLHGFRGYPFEGAAPTPGWCKPRTVTFTGQLSMAGQTTAATATPAAQSLKSRHGAS